MSVKRFKIYAISIALFGSHAVFAKEKLIDIQNWQTEKGVNVYFVSAQQNPIVDVKLLFSAGASRDEKHPGIAALTNTMLDEGTAKSTADTIAQRFENVGAQFNAGVDRDFASVSFRSLSDPQYLTPTVTIFNEIVTKPAFPDKQLARIRKQTIAKLQVEQQEPSTVASKAFYKALYGNSPYANNVHGDIKSVKKIHRKDLLQFYKHFYVANNAVLVIVGHLSTEQAHALSEEITKGMPAGKAAAPINNKAAVTDSVMKSISFPSAQTHVLMGNVGIDKKSPEYFPVMVGNFILGGSGLTSRLFEEVREKKGLVYHVASQFSSMKQPGPFYIVLQTRTKEAKNAIDITKITLNNFLQNGPTEKELEMAKNNIILSFPMKIASNKAILNAVSEIAAYQLPLDYLDTYRDNVRAVTAMQVKQTFQSLVHPSKFVTITVGKNTL